MYKDCKTPQSALRQREFEQCLLKTMRTVPYQNISISSLCTQMGIGRKNFYRYFENKDDVLCALLDHTLLEYIQYENEHATASAVPFAAIVHFLSYWQEQKSLLDVLEANNLSSRLIERMLYHAWRRDPQFLRLLKSDAEKVDPNAVLFSISGIITLIVTWHHGGYKEPKEQLAASIYRLMTEPIVDIPK